MTQTKDDTREKTQCATVRDDTMTQVKVFSRKETHCKGILLRFFYQRENFDIVKMLKIICDNCAG